MARVKKRSKGSSKGNGPQGEAIEKKPPQRKGKDGPAETGVEVGYFAISLPLSSLLG